VDTSTADRKLLSLPAISHPLYLHLLDVFHGNTKAFHCRCSYEKELHDFAKSARFPAEPDFNAATKMLQAFLLAHESGVLCERSELLSTSVVAAVFSQFLQPTNENGSSCRELVRCSSVTH